MVNVCTSEPLYQINFFLWLVHIFITVFGPRYCYKFETYKICRHVLIKRMLPQTFLKLSIILSRLYQSHSAIYYAACDISLCLVLPCAPLLQWIENCRLDTPPQSSRLCPTMFWLKTCFTRTSICIPTAPLSFWPGNTESGIYWMNLWNPLQMWVFCVSIFSLLLWLLTAREGFSTMWLLCNRVHYISDKAL